MDNTILIWKYLLPSMLENDDLQDVVDTNNIFPLAAPADTPYPFIIYHRDNISPQYTKVVYGGWDNNVSISIDVYTNDYKQGAEILNIIRNIYENKKLDNDDIHIDQIRVVAISEQFTNDGYRQTIQFDFLAE